MARRNKAGDGRRRRTFIWTFGAVAFISALLYWEQTAILYVLSTFAMVGLLLVVAFSDLEGRDKELTRELEDAVPVTAAGGEEEALTTSPLSAAAQTDRRARPKSRRPLRTGGAIK